MSALWRSLAGDNSSCLGKPMSKLWSPILYGECRRHGVACNGDLVSKLSLPLYLLEKVPAEALWMDLCVEISVRMTSVSGSYLNCTWREIWNKYQDNIRLWVVPELFLEENLNKHQGNTRLWIIPELFLEEKSGISIRITTISGSYLNFF